jgi:dolichol-phosphate mannosyltransferase
MSPEAVPPLRRRVASAIRLPHNWVQLARFCLVGASGYVVNLAVFALAFGTAGVHHRVAATLAFAVALSNNFLWNRRWTFSNHTGRAMRQAVRFVTVSIGAFLVSLAILDTLVAWAGSPELLAQATAIVCATPINFVGNRLWTFRA